MEEIILRIFGGYTMVDVVVFGWFIVIGFVINAWDETSLRDKKSKKTPRKWSWKFWFNDNWRRYIVSILSTYIFFRFYVEFVGHEITEIEAFMIGLIGDNIGSTAKERINMVKADRVRLLKEERVEHE